MKKITSAMAVGALVLAVIVVLAARHGPSALAAPGDTTADLVYGQANFTSGAQGCGVFGPITANDLCSPQSVAIDGAGRLWVSDSNNHRVLEYDNPLSNTTPQRVFGQGGSFATGTCNKGGISANSLCYPAQVTVDSRGNLWVADLGNSRVLEYDDPINTDTIADRVFGQFNSFTTNTYNNGGTSANSLWNPSGVAVDSAGNLYVADRQNARVLEYDTPLTSGTVADRVFGQGGSFTSGVVNLGGVSANSLATLLGLAVDGSDNLYVADEGNNRVLEYFTPISTNTTADRVFGQFGSFTTNIANNGGVSASSNYIPTGMAIDVAGNLYLSETGNERTLEYDNPAITDTIADQTFGHLGNFALGTNDDIGLNADSLADPWSVAIDHACHLWVADMGNNRVLEYDSPPPGCAVPATFTPTPTICPLGICTATPTATDTSTPTITPTPTNTPTCIPSPLDPCLPSVTPTDTPTDTPSPTATCDPLIGCGTPVPTDTPTPCVPMPGVDCTPTATPTCGAGVPCDTPTATDTPIATGTPCVPMPGVDCTPTATPTCDIAGCQTATATGTSTSTRTPSPTATPVCPPIPTGVMVGTISSGVSPAIGVIDANISFDGTLSGTLTPSISGLPSGSVIGTVLCGRIRFNTTAGALVFGGDIAPDGSGMSGSYIAAPSADLRVGDAGDWRLTSATADTDGDGLTDGAEVDVYHTNPYAADSDLDGYSDGVEVAASKDPLAYCGVMRADVNGDGVVNILDLSAVALHYHQPVPPAPPRLDQGPPPFDGVINILDLSKQAMVYGRMISSCG